MRSKTVKTSKSATQSHETDEEDKYDGDGDKVLNLNESIESIGSKRGRPLIPDSWTWVMTMDILKIQTYAIGTELLMGDSMPKVSRNLRQTVEWSMYFNPSEYWDSHPGLTIANCTLSERKL